MRTPTNIFKMNEKNPNNANKLRTNNNINESSKANKINSKFSERRGINILSWNIQSSTGADGNKFDDSNFLNVIKNHDIVCLQEIRKRVKLGLGHSVMCDQTKNLVVLAYYTKMN